MAKNKIYYRDGYKYQIVRDYVGKTRILGYDIEIPLWHLYKDGSYIIRMFYAYDGPSGPTWDRKSNMRASLGHDFKYQLMRLGKIPESCRGIADAELKEECLEDGMNRFSAWYYYEGVDHFAAYAAKYGTEGKIKEAP